MKPFIFSPDRKYLIKSYLGALLAIPIYLIIWGYLGALLVGVLPLFGINILDFLSPATLVAGLVVAVVAWVFLYTTLKVRNIEYEVTEYDIAMASGVMDKTMRQIPYHMITNLEVKRDWLDRLLGIGRLEIQAVGSHKKMTLVGIGDVRGLFDYVAEGMRHAYYEMADIEEHLALQDQDIMLTMADELRAIRQNLESDRDYSPRLEARNKRGYRE